jgi:alpha-tubulin suppressor-like RCC1 family protein
MHLPEYVQNISSGEQHSIIITKNEVYGLGSNLEGELGYDLPLISGLGLVKLNIGNHVKIVSVSCGWHHTLLLD